MPTRCHTIRPGRPSNPIRVFVARLMSEIHGTTTKRAMAVIAQNADRVPGCVWAAAVDAYAAGCRTLQDFERWSGEGLTQLSK